MNYHLLFAILAWCIAIIVEGRYIYSILRGDTIPNFSWWFIITFSMAIIFFASIFSGVGESIYLVGVLVTLHTIETYLAWKYGTFLITKTEKILIAISLFGIALWAFTDTPLYALLINIAIDSIGMTAIAYKLFRFPETEDIYAWGWSVLMYSMNLFAIEHFTLVDSLFTLVNVVTCGTVFLLTFRKMHLLKKVQLYFAQFLHIKI